VFVPLYVKFSGILGVIYQDSSGD